MTSKNKQQNNSSKLILIGISGVAVLLVGALFLKGSGNTDSEKNYATATVTRGSLTIDVIESGTFSAREKTVIRCEVWGRTTIIKIVDEGSQVNKDDLLIELDSSELEEKLLQQEIVVQNAEASNIRAQETAKVTQSQTESNIAEAKLKFKFAKLDLDKYLKGDYLDQLEKAKSDITIVKQKLIQAKDKLDGSEKLVDKGFITQNEFESDKLAYQIQEIDVRLTEGKLTLLNTYTHPRQVEQLESDVKQAEKALERAKLKANADIIQAQADLRAKASEFERQKTKLELYQDQIKKCKIFAPAAGRVVYADSDSGHRWRSDDPLGEGTEVQERQALIFLPTADAMMANIKIHESVRNKVKIGMPVHLTSVEIPDQFFTGRVAQIDDSPDKQSFWSNPDLKVYSTEIHIDPSKVTLRPGMSCQAKVIIEELSDIINIPLQAMIRVKGQPMVFVLKDGKTESRKIEVGSDNNYRIHVTKGLKEGEKVLLNPPLPQGKENGNGSTKQEGREPQKQSSPQAGNKNPVGPSNKQNSGRPKPNADQRQSGQPSQPSGNRPQISDEMRKQMQNATPEQRKKMIEKFRAQQRNNNKTTP